MNIGLHHLHTRKRMNTANKCEPFPARTPWIRGLDRAMYLVAVISPLALVPQAARVLGDGSISGLSLLTWSLLTGNNLLWSIYGLVHRDNPILISSSLTCLIDLAIVIGILKYST